MKDNLNINFFLCEKADTSKNDLYNIFNSLYFKTSIDKPNITIALSIDGYYEYEEQRMIDFIITKIDSTAHWVMHLGYYGFNDKGYFHKYETLDIGTVNFRDGGGKYECIAYFTYGAKCNNTAQERVKTGKKIGAFGFTVKYESLTINDN